MKYYYNKAQPNIEYGMLSSRRLNNLKRKPNADGLVTYYYTSVEEPLGGRYYRKCDYYIIPVKVTPEVYAQLMKRDKKEHNNNHKHDRRYLDVEKYYRQHGEIDEDDRETNAWECVADKKTLNFENDIIEELDKQALLSTLSGSDRIIVKLRLTTISRTVSLLTTFPESKNRQTSISSLRPCCICRPKRSKIKT